MNRKHTVEEYLTIIKNLREANPLIKFSSDFIIGYPGENENDFNNTLKLIKEVQFINFYSFIYSPRPGTPAAKLKQIKENISKKRLIIFQRKASELKMIYRKKLFNSLSKVLFDNKLSGNNFFGRDEYLNSVIVKSNKNLLGKIKDVKIIKGNQNTLFGEIVDVNNKKDFAA